MSSNKDRLYVALYVRRGDPIMPGKEDTYHWALIIGPKNEAQGKTGVRYHAREIQKVDGGSAWFFEERECLLTPTSMLRVRVMVSKVADGNRLAQILRKIPIRQNLQGWNCVAWVKEALESLNADGTALCTTVDWETVRTETMEYCQKKTDQNRFDGQGSFDLTKAPTYDSVKRKEIII
ncbi:hypothetical protein BDW75DRAFT_250907 [Aspergillus navahoensis]